MNSTEINNQDIKTNTSCAERQIGEVLQPQTQSSAPAPIEIANIPERNWSIGCMNSHVREYLRSRFESLAARAAEVALQTKYEHRFQAVDAWLDLLKRETRFAHEWKISLLLTASAEYCGELKLRALTSERRWDAEIWSEIERQLRTIIAENPRDELYAIDRGVNPSIVSSPNPKDTSGAASEPSGRTDRQLKVDAYITEVWERTGKRITRADIWRAARYKSRAEFERWESRYYEKRGKKVNASAHARFMKILTEKPHLKIFHASPRISTPCATPGVEPNTATGTARPLSQRVKNEINEEQQSA